MHKPSLKIPILEAQDISKSYDINYGSYFSFKKERLNVIKRLNLSINKGESFGIIGESGCGKSTLARILIGLDTPDKGKIKINNQDKSDLSSIEITKFNRSTIRYWSRSLISPSYCRYSQTINGFTNPICS